MSTEATILLVATEAPPEGLERALEAAGLFVEVTTAEELHTALQVVAPEIVVQVGALRALSTVSLLQAHAQISERVGLVLLGARQDLAALRRLDREVVQAVLALDIPLKIVVDRIRALADQWLAERAEAGRADASVRPASRPTPIPSPQTAEEKIRAWVQSSRPPVITELDAADELIEARWEGQHEFAPYVDVVPASAEDDATESEADAADSVTEGDPEDDRETLVADSLLAAFVSESGETPAAPGLIETQERASSDTSQNPLHGDRDASGDDDGRPTLAIDDVLRPTLPLPTSSVEGTSGEASRDLRPAAFGEVSTASAVRDSAEAPPHATAKTPGSSLGSKLGAAIAAVALAASALYFVRGASPTPIEPARTPSREFGSPPETDRQADAAPPAKSGSAPSEASSPASVPAATSVSTASPNDLWQVPENPAVKSCEQLVPNREELRLGDTDQSSRYWKRARGLLLLGDVQNALVALCQASLVYPSGLVTEALVEHLLSVGAPRAASPVMAAARALRPNRPRTLELAGDVECQLGKPDEARSLWLSALGLDAPSDATMKQVAKQIVAQAAAVRKGGQVGFADRLYRRAAIFDPKNVDAWRGLSELATERGQADRARMFDERLAQNRAP